MRKRKHKNQPPDALSKCVEVHRDPAKGKKPGAIDEVYAFRSVEVHMERLSDECVWIGLYMPNGEKWRLEFSSSRKVKILCEQDYPPSK